MFERQIKKCLATLSVAAAELDYDPIVLQRRVLLLGCSLSSLSLVSSLIHPAPFPPLDTYRD
jgi:hypothetical protein